MKPVRIQRSRQHKQVSPNGLPVVYVGRPGKWGNIYTVGNSCVDPEYWKSTEVETKELAVKCFKVWIGYQIQKDKDYLKELKGKNLSCWCKVGEPCHADILLKIANQ